MREQRIRSHVVRLTCAVDGRSHRVTDHAFDVGRRDGYCRALCGHTVVAAALVSPDGAPCRSCSQRADWLEAGRAAGRIARHRRPGMLRRLAANFNGP